MESDKECLVLQVCCQNQAERLYRLCGIFLSDLKFCACLKTAIVVSKCHTSHKLFTLIPQVSVLTDQVEVQGEKIRDLDSSLEEHRMKLNATEELLQQVCGLLYKLMFNNRSAQHLRVHSHL